MDYSKEFKNYATKHHGVSSTYYDKIVSSMTPYIIEERQLNVAQMDVFSRLMMDRIMFLGTAITDSVANVIQAQLLFLQSTDSSRDIQMYINILETLQIIGLLNIIPKLFVMDTEDIGYHHYRMRSCTGRNEIFLGNVAKSDRN